jgi:hypothetical protein
VTGTKKLGTAAAYFDGDGDYLSLADSEDWNFGSGDFTIDFWINPSSVAPGDKDLVSSGNVGAGNSYWFIRNDAGLIRFSLVVGGVFQANIIDSVSMVAGNWYHVAMIRSGNDWKLYKNGVLVGSVSNPVIFPSLSTPVRVGAGDNAGSAYRFYSGYFDELSISKGVARWTSNFTPPNSQYYWWNWGCNGLNGGSNVVCGANKYQ